MDTSSISQTKNGNEGQTGCEACIKKDEIISELYEALKHLPEPKSILAEAAYTGGNVPKKWIAEHSQFIDGYNQALKDVAKLREQALAKVKQD